MHRSTWLAHGAWADRQPTAHGSARADGPLEVKLTDGLHEIRFVDPDRPACGGQNDPNDDNCLREVRLLVKGVGSGPALPKIVN